MIVALIGILMFVSHIANKNYEARKKLETQLAAEKESVYQMQYLNYQKEKEIEQMKQDLDAIGLCSIKLSKKI